MRPLLEGIQSASEALRGFLDQLRNLWEQVVWPISEINRARGLAQQLIATFRGLLNSLYSIGVNSAQLPNPTRLEGVMRNRQVNDQGQLVTAFRQTFGALPAPADVHPEERNLIDIDDALAIDQLMTLKMGDASADQVLQAAEAIEDEATRAGARNGRHGIRRCVHRFGAEPGAHAEDDRGAVASGGGADCPRHDDPEAQRDVHKGIPEQDDGVESIGRNYGTAVPLLEIRLHRTGLQIVALLLILSLVAPHPATGAIRIPVRADRDHQQRSEHDEQRDDLQSTTLCAT